ncbi:MAG TPA: RNA polymerase sigma factor [Miltoncostaeaceae bacterium]|nr:RNA polymerase sigma factor [Miltoncostaeaceae bacterium]
MSSAITREGAAAAAHPWAHQADLTAYARRILGDQADLAEDVVQEAYLRLLALAAADQPPASARPWLFRVVRNLAIDERRGAARRALPVAEPADWGAHGDDPAELAERRQDAEAVLAGLAALPPKERRALELEQAGVGASEIAAELGTSTNAVHQALFRARRRLRSARAVAWSLAPIPLVSLAYKLGDTGLANTLAGMPPGSGRAVPVAGVAGAIVATLVGGGVVVIHQIDRQPVSSPNARVVAVEGASGPIAQRAPAAGTSFVVGGRSLRLPASASGGSSGARESVGSSSKGPGPAAAVVGRTVRQPSDSGPGPSARSGRDSGLSGSSGPSASSGSSSSSGSGPAVAAVAAAAAAGADHHRGRDDGGATATSGRKAGARQGGQSGSEPAKAHRSGSGKHRKAVAPAAVDPTPPVAEHPPEAPEVDVPEVDDPNAPSGGRLTGSRGGPQTP